MSAETAAVAVAPAPAPAAPQPQGMRKNGKTKLTTSANLVSAESCADYAF